MVPPSIATSLGHNLRILYLLELDALKDSYVDGARPPFELWGWSCS